MSMSRCAGYAAGIGILCAPLSPLDNNEGITEKAQTSMYVPQWRDSRVEVELMWMLIADPCGSAEEAGWTWRVRWQVVQRYANQ